MKFGKECFFAVMILSLSLLTKNSEAYWQQVWSDEFNAAANTGADATKWMYNTNIHVNNEKQQYTTSIKNTFHDGQGNIVLRGLHESSGNYQYTSGRLESNGKYSFKYGRVECRAKLPAGGGTWPAIWMLGTSGNWPACGEIDIMEQNGNAAKTTVQSDSHTSPNQTSTELGNISAASYRFPDGGNSYSDYHLYSLDWYADSMSFQVDGNTIARTPLGMTSPFRNNSFYLILNVALGGAMGGTIDNNAFPDDMIIDYIKVYKYSATPTQIVLDRNNFTIQNNQQASTRTDMFYDLSGRSIPAAVAIQNRVADGLVIVKDENGFRAQRLLQYRYDR